MPESNDDPTPLNPSQPSIPVSYPIKTLEELDSRAYFKSFHYPYNKSNVPLKASALEKRPRILVCHDMQGGYIDDKWVQGHTNEGAYAIWHWYLIDVFVYFSHYLVTLPPPCWTNSAHRHGVKVLGTFITEGDQGREICNTLLATKESAHMYAERLAELSAALGFDGWLLNMEVQLDIKQIPNLKEFVIQLTETMHSSVPGSLVIWYDSVTVDGELFWQNQLNEKNKPFFDISDGILVNYSWEQDYPKLSAAVAGDRRFDVYMGIDVFGRGTYGGGQWDTNVALDVLKKDDVSACLFAPGWVYETKQPPDFQTAQNHWWSLVEKSWGVFNLYPKTLPFYSNFDQGHGYHISVEGEQASNAPWNNISAQGLQPFLEYKNDPNTIQVLVNSKKASYNGGGNITFMGPLAKNTDYTVRLFKGELQLGRSPLYLTYSVNSDINSQLGLSLQFSSTVNERKSVLIAPWSSSKFSEVIVPYQVNNIGVAPGWKIQASSIEMHGYILTEIHAVCYIPKPKNPEREPEYSFDSAGPSDFYAVLGDITIKTTKENTIFPPPNSWQVQARHIKWSSRSAGSRTLSAEIVWNLKDRTGSGYPKYNIYVQKLPKQAFEDSDGGLEGKIQEYIGVANVEAFYISDLSIPSSTSSLKFIIQGCGVDGAIQELNESPSLQLNVEGHQTFIEKLLRIRMSYCFRFCFSFFRGLELGQRKR